MNRIYWGDIHNHNEVGYGKGSLERSFRLARNTLDFYAFTAHGWWTDVPKNDEAIRRHHEAGFAKVRARWDEVRQTVEEQDTPGEFVTFPAWEWHSLRWGDYCIYFPDDQSELHYAGDLDELKEVARRTGAILIPHHPAYRSGWRGLDWDQLDPQYSPVVEIFSEHGNSLEAASHWGMYSHSMGGSDRSQTAMEQLKRGRRFGLLASSDDHFGYPGGYGQGLTAILAPDLTRESVFSALRARHTYAVTGDRIEVDLRVNGGIPGDVIEPADDVSIAARISGRDRIRYVEIWKNGGLWRSFGAGSWTAQSGAGPAQSGAGTTGPAGSATGPAGGRAQLGARTAGSGGSVGGPAAWATGPAGSTAGPSRCTAGPDTSEHLVRLEWGWDLLSSEEVTTWNIDVSVEDSSVSQVSPAFCGGAGSVTEDNLLYEVGPAGFKVKSFTSRANTRPVSSVSFVWDGSAGSQLHLVAEGHNGTRPFEKKLTVLKQDLTDQDQYVSAFDLFSSPKIKLHNLIPNSERNILVETQDSEAQPGDFYLLKVEQENGQMAWCSPVWVGGGTE